VTEPRFRVPPADQTTDALELEMLAKWTAEDLLARTIREREGAKDFVFFEGPPTANGRPGIHHVFSRTIKDLFCRYQVMKGRRVLRKAGWDTHGLPVEIEVEKQLGLNGKPEIEKYGVAAFNAKCRESVWKYKGDWERLSARIGYWLDYSDPYITYSNDYIESVWWALATLHTRGLLYIGHKILPYCARCGTALSSHEVAQGYRDVKDPSVYLMLELVPARESGVGNRPSPESRILVWTTTPWTLVSNVALAVNPEFTYVELKRRGKDDPPLVMAESRAAAVLGEDWADRWEIVSSFPGTALVGRTYKRPLDWLPYPEGKHEIIVGESFVSAEDGSGVVHMAPAFGADDFEAGKRHGLSLLHPVDDRGRFPADLPLVGGKFVKEADPAITEELKRRGVLWKSGTIEHSYPHCWRCDTPLIYYARKSYFIRTTGFRDQMLARNARVDWHPPEVGHGRFGEWLENNIDWALSRDRYWGTPLPIWVCERDAGHVVAIGSYAKLEEHWGKPLPADFDPHKPYIDEYMWTCTHAQCGGTMRRAPQVIDTWFDSGSMPFAQWHYPFANKELAAKQFPADYIAEGVDQTRGWFYSLLAIAAGLGSALPNNEAPDGTSALAAPYRSVVVNDLVLDETGAKMSKHVGNVVDPNTVIPRHGADAVRLFLVASSQVWVPRRFDEEAIREVAGRFLLTLRNIYGGIFAQYANFGWAPGPQDPAPAARPAVDRWILSRLATVESEVDALMARYEATLAARAVMDFVTDDVSNWYVRLNRSRFYDVDTPDSRAAFATLHEVLTVSCRLLAPFAPFLTDWMHRELTGDSVHVAAYVRAGAPATDHALEQAMSQLRTLATLGRAAREDADVKVRQPLERIICVVPGKRGAELDALEPLLRSELNVKKLEWASSGDALVRLEAKPNFRALGKRFGKATPIAAQAVAALSTEVLARFEHGEPVAISVAGESHTLTADDLELVRRASGDLVVKETGGFFVALDPTVTPALREEGIARELVSRIQRLRKEGGLAVSDRVKVHLAGAPEVEAAARARTDYISAEVLAREVAIGGPGPARPDAMSADDLDGSAVRIAISRVS
jgi:isoleucyl-tRNA synthetase